MMSSVLSSPVLVLNKGWRAVRIDNVKDCILTVINGSAHIADTGRTVEDSSYEPCSWGQWEDRYSFEMNINSEYKCIRTPTNKIRVPELIVLTNYDKIPNQSVRLTRRNLFIRDHFRCQYTGQKLTMKNGTIDHVIPRSQGGTTVWDNVVLASIDANVKKGGRTPAQAGMKLLKKPKKPNWHPLYTKWTSEYPASWEPFIKTDKWNEIGYWDVELID